MPAKSAYSSCCTWLPIALGAMIATSMGCGNNRIPTYPVQGRVVFADNKPVQFGTVEFYNSTHDRTAYGRIDRDGNFQLGTFQEKDGAVAGKHQVIVVQVHMPGEPNLSIAPTHGDHVSPRFSQYESSGIEVTVEPQRKNRVTLTVERK